MDQASWHRVKSLFEEAIDLPADQRSRFLTSLAAEDGLRTQVESLLAAHDDAGTFMDAPTHEAAGAAFPPDGDTGAAAFDLTGRSIGRYKLIERLGEGGFGTVYRAEQHEPIRREVALKIIKPGMDTAQVVARFEAERQALAMMDHPNIARVLDGGATDEGRPYFVMELVRGEPITKFCDRASLDTRARLALYLRVCEAVQHAHQKGIIHRDIKPSNVLVAEQDGGRVAKVIDFGIAKAIDARLTEATMITADSQLVGTPAYMSPEQADGAADIDTRSDIYALGVLLYELLTGSPPFDPTTLRNAGFAELQRIIREQEPARPSTRISSMGDRLGDVARSRRAQPQQLSRQLRGDLDWIVMKAIEKDRSRRYETAAALIADVEHHLRDEPVEAGPPSTTYRVKKFVRRHRAGVGAGAIAAAAMIGGLALATFGFVRATRAEASAITARDRATEAQNEAVAQRDEAQRQAAIAAAVNEFLNDDLLAAASPENTDDREITVREVLDAAAANIEGRFTDEPLIEAAIRVTLGRTYRSLSDYAKAEPHFEAAVKIRTEILGENDPSTLKAINHLAFNMDRAGRMNEGIALHEKVLAVRRVLSGDEDHDTLASANNLGMNYAELGRYEEAELLLREAYETRMRVLGEDHEDTLTSANNLASLYWDQEQFDPAEQLYVEVLAARRRVLGDDHPHTLNTMGNLGTVYLGQKKFDEAEAILVEQRDRCVRVLGASHHTTMQAFNNLAVVYFRQEKIDEATEQFETIVAAMRQNLPPDHWNIASALNNYAFCLIKAGRQEEAEAALLESYDIFAKTFSPEHYRVQGNISKLVNLYTQMGKPEQAEEWRAKLTPPDEPAD